MNYKKASIQKRLSDIEKEFNNLTFRIFNHLRVIALAFIAVAFSIFNGFIDLANARRCYEAFALLVTLIFAFIITEWSLFELYVFENKKIDNLLEQSKINGEIIYIDSEELKRINESKNTFKMNILLILFLLAFGIVEIGFMIFRPLMNGEQLQQLPIAFNILVWAGLIMTIAVFIGYNRCKKICMRLKWWIMQILRSVKRKVTK